MVVHLRQLALRVLLKTWVSIPAFSSMLRMNALLDFVIRNSFSSYDDSLRLSTFGDF